MASRAITARPDPRVALAYEYGYMHGRMDDFDPRAAFCLSYRLGLASGREAQTHEEPIAPEGLRHDAA